MFRNIRLAVLLGGGFGALIIVLVVVVGLSVFNFQRTAEARHQNEHTLRVLTLKEDLLTALLNVETGLRGFMITGLEEYLEPYEQGRESFARHHEEITTLTADNPAQQERLEMLLERYQGWMDSAVTPTIQMREDLNRGIGDFDLIASSAGYGRSGMEAMRTLLEELEAEVVAELQVRGAVLDRNNTIAIASLIGGLIIGALIGILTAILVTRLITGAVRRALDAARAVANGDLSVRIEANGRNELQQLLAALGEMVGGLRTMISEITGSATQVSTASEQMSVIADKTLQDTERQKDRTTQVATAINQMTASTQEIARNTQQTSDAANDSKYKVSEGKTVVGNTIDGMEKLAAEVEEVAQVVRRLGERSENIGSVLDVIRGIADQTNLLALNAAIEAARAGDHGRGFAVVATEVRQLASRTQASIGEIEQMIGDLQTGARQAVQAMEQGRAQAAESVKKAEQTGVTFDAIADSVQTISDMTNQIASAVEEQTSVAEEINRNVIGIHDITEQTHASTRETASSSESMAALATQLQGMVARFRV